MADQQHTISSGDSKEGDETNNRRNTDLTRGHPKNQHAANQGQGQVQEDHTTLFHILKLMIEQHEDHQKRHQRGEQKRTAGRLLTLELTTILNMVALRQSDTCIHPLTDLVHDTTQIPTGDIGANHDLALHVLPVDRVRTGHTTHLRHLAQRHLLSARINQQVGNVVHRSPAGIGSLYGQVETLAVVIHLANHLTA